MNQLFHLDPPICKKETQRTSLDFGGDMGLIGEYCFYLLDDLKSCQF